jgi:hypothetical protein
MKIMPTGIEDQINRMDRQRSLYIGLSAASLALWSAYRLIWTFYIAMAYGWFVGPMIFPVVLWGVVGTVAGVAAFGFLTRYLRES